MESEPLLPKKTQPRMPRVRRVNRYVVGVLLLLGVVLLWTASNFITAELETGDKAWNKPFLITYLNTSSFALYLIPAAWRHYKKRGRERSNSITSRGTRDERNGGYRAIPSSPRTSVERERSGRMLDTSPLTLTRSISPSSPRAPLAPLVDDAVEPTAPGALPKLSVRETAEIAAWWSAVWFLANWSLNAALAWASVASVTILSSTTSFFTLTLGRMFRVEDVTRGKVLSSVASFIGVVLVTCSDATLGSDALLAAATPAHPILGDALALLSAFFYSVYVILLKVRLGDESRADTQLMLGFAGLFNIICLIPVFPILHILGWETFEFPPTRSAWMICIINMFITLSSDYLYVLAMLKTTPMLVTIGLSLTIPFALIGSLFVPSSAGDSITIMSLTGAALVVGSFLVLGWQGWEESEENEREQSVALGEDEYDG